MCGVCSPSFGGSGTPHTYEDKMCWRCLTLPQPHDCSTISAVKLSYRDRNGTGRTLDAKTTNTNLIQTTPTPQQGTGSVLCQTLYNKHKHNNHSSFRGKHMFLAHYCFLIAHTHEKHKGVFCVGVLVPVTYNTSPCSQPWPINPIIHGEPQQKPHLKTGFPLRCFQRLSLPHVANQPCHWRDNWHTRGTSIPVLSY